MIAFSAPCYVTRWAVENLSALHTRHCMEFKITMNKITRRKKILLFLIKLRKYTHLAPGFCCPFGLFRRFFFFLGGGGGFRFKKGNILLYRAILSFVILNSMKCLVERSNSQRLNV